MVGGGLFGSVEVLEVIDRITNQLDQGITPINIYLDLSKAFDTLDHDILVNKLQYYGVNGPAFSPSFMLPSAIYNLH